MISQRCPRCASRRVRRGYRPTPLWSKFLFRYHLLCDACNWEFAGFAVPGTVTTRPVKRRKTDHSETENANTGSDGNLEPAPGETKKKLKKTRTKIRL